MSNVLIAKKLRKTHTFLKQGSYGHMLSKKG